MNKIHWLAKVAKSFLKEGILVTGANINEWSRVECFERMDMKSIHIVSDDVLQKQRMQNREKKCVISVITPLYNTPSSYLKEMLDSVVTQTYVHWELCLADGSDSEHIDVQEICEKYAAQDARIKYSKLNKNGGIAENTNYCLKMTTGEYIGILDHDDILHPSALYEVAKVIYNEQADFIYTDEAKFTNAITDVCELNLKSGFGKDELRSHNYICHFNVFKKDLLEKSGGLYRSEYDGSQDHDMVLRLSENASKIVHISKVLYYWRVHENSVAMNLDSKPYAVDSALKAISAQLLRRGEKGSVSCNSPYKTIYRVCYEIEKEGLVTIILHHTYAIKDVKKAINYISKSSSYQKIEYLYDPMEIDYNENNVFGELAKKAKGTQIIFLDARCIPHNEKWIQEMLMHSQRKDVFAVGAKVLYKKKIILNAGLVVTPKGDVRFLGKGKSNSNQGYEAMYRYARNSLAVSAMCLMVEKKKLFDVINLPVKETGFYDIQMCLEASAKGLDNIWTCFAEVSSADKKMINDYYLDNNLGFASWWKEQDNHNDKYLHPLWTVLDLL